MKPKISKAARQIWRNRLDSLLNRPLMKDEADEACALSQKLGIHLDWKIHYLNDGDGWVDNPERRIPDAPNG